MERYACLYYVIEIKKKKKKKECIEIIDELKANDITYTIRKILPE